MTTKAEIESIGRVLAAKDNQIEELRSQLKQARRAEDKTYNGWTNYATWRINLELFDGSEGPWDHHSAKEFAEEIIYSTTTEGVARDYALAFIADVDWYEIASHYQSEPEEV